METTNREGIIRGLFLGNAAILLVAIPVFKEDALLPVSFALLLIIALVISAALTSKKFGFITGINAVLSLIGLVTFEYLAFLSQSPLTVLTFTVRQALALSFLATLYLSVRTLFKKYTKGKTPQNVSNEHEEIVNMPGEDVSNEELLSK